MSAGRSAPRSGGSGGPVDDDICELLSFEAVLQSPQPVAVSALTIGEVLFISVRTDAANPAGRVVEARRSDGEFVGTIVENLVRLLPCLSRNYTYVGEVRTINGGEVRVRVRRP